MRRRDEASDQGTRRRGPYPRPKPTRLARAARPWPPVASLCFWLTSALPSLLWRYTPERAQVDDDGNIIDSCFKTFGCGSAIASSSLATEWVKGRTLDDVVEIKNSDIAKHLSLPPVKLHCSMLAEDAIKVRYAGECAGAVLRVGEPEKLTQPCSFFLPAVWDTAFSTEGRGEGLEAEE